MEQPDTLQDTIAFAVAVERRIAELYREFSTKVQVHRDFWWELSLEEENHASILRSLLVAPPLLRGSERIVEPDCKRSGGLERLDELLRDVATRSTLKPADALRMGINCEDLSIEKTFQSFVTETSRTKAQEILQRLNGEDLHHARRMQELLDTTEENP